MKQPYVEIEHFEDDGFYEVNRPAIEGYAFLRARGIYSRAAFIRVFGHNNAVYPEVLQKIELVEASEIYNAAFERFLKSIPVDQILSDRKALHMYLDIANNPLFKESVRVAAIKEACVLAGITTIDDANRTRRVPTLTDLYAEHGAALEAKANGTGENPLH